MSDDVSARAQEYAAVVARSLAQVSDPVRFRELIALYRERYGNVFDTDDARNLFEDYANADNQKRGRISQAVHEAASQVASAALNQRIREPAMSRESNVVAILAGGSGSGKGTIRRDLIDGINSPQQHALYDTTLSNYETAKQSINAILMAGKDVTIFYVHRPVELAMEGVQKRQLVTGRSVPPEFVAQSHYNAQNTIIKLSQEFIDDPRVSIIVFDNSIENTPYRLGSIDATILSMRYNSIEDVQERLRKVQAYEVDRSRSFSSGNAREAEQSNNREVDSELSSRAEKSSRGAGADPQRQGKETSVETLPGTQPSANDQQTSPLGQYSGELSHATNTIPKGLLQMSVTALKWDLEPIADGELKEYSAEERTAASQIIQRLDILEPNDQLEVHEDLHVELREPEYLLTQIENAQLETSEQYLEQEQSHGLSHDIEP